MIKHDVKSHHILLNFDVFYRKIFYPGTIEFNFIQQDKIQEFLVNLSNNMRESIRNFNRHILNLSNALILILIVILVFLYMGIIYV